MSWNVKGAYVETCSCELVCPCTTSFDHGATYDYCRITLVFDIREGDVEGTDVGGLRVAAIADTPKVMTEGNWRLGIFVDERATDEQFDRLVGVFGGQMGGPMAALAPLISEVLGIEQHPIEFHDSGHKHHLKIGGDIAIDVEDYVPQGFTEPTQLVGVFHPSNTTLTIARPTSSRIKAFKMEFHNSGKSAFSAPFRWSA